MVRLRAVTTVRQARWRNYLNKSISKKTKRKIFFLFPVVTAFNVGTATGKCFFFFFFFFFLLKMTSGREITVLFCLEMTRFSLQES